MNKPVGATRRPYVRPMTGWWKRDPFFVSYMAREMTAFGVAAYAVILCVGVVRLAQGQAAWDGWLDALRSPLSLVLHAVLLLCMLVHAKSWFEVMPKTMPAMHVGGKRLEAATITRAGLLATAVASALLFALVWWGRS